MSRRSDTLIMGDNHVAILPRARAFYSMAADTSVEFNPRESVPSSPYYASSYYTDENYFGESFQYGGYKIAPNGPDNLFPFHFKRLIDSNDKLNSMLRQKIDLLVAGNIVQYVEVSQGNALVRKELLDNEITDWLESWDFNSYILELVTDFIFLENCYSLMIRNIAGRFSILKEEARIAEIRYMPAEDMRIGWVESTLHQGFDRFYHANWLFPRLITQYPAYDRKKPFAANASVFFSRMPTFGSKYYGRPPFIGIVSYLELKSLILNWQKDNLRNTQFKWHVESSFDFWETVARHHGWSMDGPEIKKYEEELLGQIDQFLRSESAENAQKRFHSKFGNSQFGHEKVSGWKITALEDNTLKNSEAYLKAAEQIDSSIIASVHLDPALSNIQQQGKLSSGLDKLIAFNIHQLTATPVPRRLVLAAVNEAIRVNFWRDDFRPRLGFRESQMSYQEKGLATTVDPQTGEGKK
jgi:hypothetical protein